MDNVVIRRIHLLRQMSVPQLRREWERLNGKPSRSRNRDYLFRRLAWRVQEIARGDLSNAAKVRVSELGSAFTRSRTPREALDAATAANVKPVVAMQSRSKRDPRLPSPGTVITRTYRGRELRLLVLEDGFELDGVHYRSLSEAARAVTGSKWNGRLFWKLTQRKRKS
jgi:hypothetical protein